MPDKPITSAILGVIGGSAAAAIITLYTSSRVERQKFDYVIIQQALQADTQSEREARLKFLIELNFIQDPVLRDQLSTKLKDKANLPQLPAAVAPIAPPSEPDLTESNTPNKDLLARFFSPSRKERSLAFDEIGRRRSSDDVLLSELMTEAKNHLSEGDMVVNSLSILQRFSDGALVRSRASVEAHLKDLDNLIKSQPGDWGQTAKAVKDVRARLQKLPTEP